MEIPASQTGRWLLLVQSSKPNQTVTLRWRSSRQLASKAVLVDPTTRRSVNLSGAGELTVVTDEQGKKQLLLNLGIPTDVPLRIVDLKVTRTRGKGYIISGPVDLSCDGSSGNQDIDGSVSSRPCRFK